FKGEKTYVVLPGSKTRNGVYRWNHHPDDIPLAPVPTWIPKTVGEAKDVTERDRSHLCTSLSLSVPLCNVSPDEVIQLTLPQKPGERNFRLLDLARGLKFNAGLGEAGIAELTPIVHRWFKLALPNIDTKDFEITLSEFERA